MAAFLVRPIASFYSHYYSQIGRNRLYEAARNRTKGKLANTKRDQRGGIGPLLAGLLIRGFKVVSGCGTEP